MRPWISLLVCDSSSNDVEIIFIWNTSCIVSSYVGNFDLCAVFKTLIGEQSFVYYFLEWVRAYIEVHNLLCIFYFVWPLVFLMHHICFLCTLLLANVNILNVWLLKNK